ncbi:lectizyme-like [Haematobia irritans]|uniref:Putative trypsin-like protein n=1 Tax=Haematobia irritans TaxID=7368 RepID=A0A1L8EFC3_HAEIR
MANVRQSLYLGILLLLAFTQLSHTISQKSETKPRGRVVGGTDAAVNSAPYIVSFQQNGVHYCAGSILNANWILTAAHCLSSSTQAMSTTLVAGSNNVGTNNNVGTTQTRSIDYFVVNDLYLGGTSPYDIGLVYTKTVFQWSDAVAAITLPSSGVVPTGNANLYGWGSVSTTTTASYPTVLQVATVPIISLDTCESALGTDVHTTNLCTGPLTGGVGICTSDSGGPLVQQVNNVNVLIGIVSWGKLPCGQSNSPSVYVQVSSFISWIAQNQVVPSSLR